MIIIRIKPQKGGLATMIDPGDSPTGELIALYDEIDKTAVFLYNGEWDCLGQEPDSLKWGNPENDPWERGSWKIGVYVSYTVIT
jgi:hypothetical protein